MNKQERIEALSQMMAPRAPGFFRPQATIAVEFMEKEYAELVEAAQFLADENFACGDHYCDWCGCMTKAAESLDGPLNNLKEPSHD